MELWSGHKKNYFSLLISKFSILTDFFFIQKTNLLRSFNFSDIRNANGSCFLLHNHVLTAAPLLRGGLFRQIRIFFEHCSKGGGGQTHVKKICCKFCMIIKAFWQHKIDIKRLFKGRNVSIWG